MSGRTPPPLDLGVLSKWAPEVAQTFVTLSSDIALVMDGGGVIQNVLQAGAEPFAAAAEDWIGRAWVDTVTGETRSKVEQLLKEVDAHGISRKREINHPAGVGASVAVAYTAVRLGAEGPVLVVGRDLRSTTAIQKRFLDAQQEMEKGYWRARQAEARYRLLFQVATDAVLVVDAHSFQILEANHAAGQLFELGADQLVGRQAAFGFELHSRGAVNELLGSARTSGQPSEIRARLSGKVTGTSVLATPFRTEDAMRLLVRVRTVDMPGSSADLNGTLARLVDGSSDGVVVTDSAGRILIANPAFLKLVAMSTEADVKGRPLMDWVGVSDQQFALVLQQVRRQGIARRISSRLMTSNASVFDVEVSAALLTEGDQECIGFTIHFLSPERMRSGDPMAQLMVAIEALTATMGSVALPGLLHDSVALVRAHFARIALERCANDPALAAGLLGMDLHTFQAGGFDASHAAVRAPGPESS
jgi:transcriptional regulator PpsR